MTPTFKAYKGYQGQWVTVEEQENAWREEQAQEDERETSLILCWLASNGQLIEVFDFDGLAFSIDGHSPYINCQICSVPAAQAAKMAAAGIVAVLRSELGKQIGLTAERKAAIEAAVK